MQFSKEKEGIRPLRALQEDSTITRYATTFRALVIFLLNSHPHQVARRDIDPRGLYRSPVDLGTQLSHLREILISLVRNPSDDPTEPPTPAPPLGGDTPYDSEDEELEAEEALQAPLSSESSWLDHLPFTRTTIKATASLLRDLFLGLARLTVSEGKDTPLYIFTACYSLDYTQGNFKPINLISQAYSAIIRGYQFLVLLESYEPVNPESIDAVFVSDDGDPTADRVYLFMTAYFQAQTSSPLGDILALRNYTLAMIRQSSSDGPTVTRHGPDHLAYQGIDLRVSTLTEFLRLYTLEASRSLLDLVFGHPYWVTITREVRVSEIGAREDWARAAADFGYSNEDSPFHDFLAKIAFGARASDWLLAPNSPRDIPQINRGTAIAYLTKIDSFLTDLLVLIHMTSGAPARGTEISQVLRAPSALGFRNLFFDPQRGLFLIRLTYSKTFSTTNIEQKAVRVVPESLSYLLLVYLVIVFPFRAFLAEMLSLDLRPELLFCLYQGRVVSSQQLKQRLALKSETFIGQRIGLKAWRHLAQGFIRYGMQEALLDEGFDDHDLATDEAIGASQMHHSVRTGQLIYGRTKGQFNDLAKDTQDIYIEFTLRWHQYIGIGDDFDVFWHLYPSIPTTRSLAPVAPSPSPRPQAPQSPQGPPRTLGLRPFEPSQPALTARFRPTSPITTTVSVGLLEAFKGLQAQQVPTVPWDSALNEEQLDPLQLFKDYSQVLTDHPMDPTTDVLLTLLREFLGDPSATFQSPEQREALLTMVLNIDSSVFIVLPTGGGKTTLFLLSASLSTSKITLLVVPLVSLREDLLAKTKALGLKTTIWEQDLGDAISTYYGPQLVIISAETATKAKGPYNPREAASIYYCHPKPPNPKWDHG
ncbi:hypothetical protein N7501_002885 [Penicillium viridicatum]|nr:hypothetical protein N7501_002885 [Penicillium viridicatum]